MVVWFVYFTFPVVAFWQFWGMGMISTGPYDFQCDFFEIMVFDGYKGLLVDFDHHLLTCASNDKKMMPANSKPQF